MASSPVLWYAPASLPKLYVLTRVFQYVRAFISDEIRQSKIRIVEHDGFEKQRGLFTWVFAVGGRLLRLFRVRLGCLRSDGGD